MPLSQNRWETLVRSECHDWVIHPTVPRIPLVRGPGGFLLAHFALWHHQVVESLGGRVHDDWGYAYRPVRGSDFGWSNHASGTAMDLNATAHPLGVRNTYSAEQIRTIRARLRGRYDDRIRWGGDYERRADEMHYELDCSPVEARALADRLRDTPRGWRLVTRNRRATDW